MDLIKPHIFNIFTLSSLTAFIVCLFLAIFVIIKGKNKKENKLFGLATLSTGIWCLFPFITAITPNQNVALNLTRCIYISAVFVPSLWFNFMLLLINRDKAEKKFINSAYIISLIMVPFVLTPSFIRNIGRFAPHFYVIPGPLYKFFIIIYSLLTTYALFQLLTSVKSQKGYRRNQLIYMVWAFCFGISSGVMHFISAYFNKEPFPHDLLIIAYPGIIAYAIVRYRLMDIGIAVTRAAVFLIVYGLVLGTPFTLSALLKDWFMKHLGSNWWMGPFGSLVILGTLGPFVYVYLEKRAEAILFKEQRRYQEKLKDAAVDITRIRNLQQLLDFIVKLLSDAVKISHAMIYFFDTNSNQFVLKAVVNQKPEQPNTISKNNALIDWFEQHKEQLVYEEIKKKSEDNPKSIFHKLEKQMRELNANIMIPCFLEEKLLDVIILGEKVSGRIYTSEDLNNFSVLAGEVALATENAQLYGKIEEEVRQRTEQLAGVQKQLVQAEKLATVGTLAGGVAHEINNPLTAILTNVQMLLTINGSLDSDTKESLELIEEATKRCRTIVQKLMDYSKKPLESTILIKMDISEVIKKTISFLSYQLEQENIKIITDFKEGEYFVNVNPNELEQVLTNIILNAKDAILKKKKGGSIHIFLSKEKKKVKIEIRDDGIGMPKEIISRIFDPFFTTKDVGKGLGLGLSICHAIIDKHSGTIKVESEVNKGSTFIIEFPSKEG